MGRVTRRSVASKDSTPKESPKSAGRRGAKKEEPAEEATGSQETPKRRGRQSTKEEPTPDVPAKGKTTRGRSTSRKSEEPKVEEVEKEKKGTARSRGRKGQDDKSAAAEQTVEKGKKTDEEESEEEAEKESEEKEPEENNVPARSRGGRGKGKATPTPAPRSGGRGRSKASAAEQEEEEQQVDSKTEDSEETKDTAGEAEVTPSSRRRGTAKSADAASTPPSSGRRGKAGKSEAAPKTTPASGRSSRRGHGSEEAAEEDDAVDGAGDAGEEKGQVEQEGAQEPAAQAEPTTEKGDEPTAEKDELTTAESAEKEGAESKSEPMEVAESQETSVPGKKRKLEEEEPESKSPVKKPRLEETENKQSKESSVTAAEPEVIPNVQEAPPEQPTTQSVESEPGPAEDISTDAPAPDTSAKTQPSQSAASESATTEGTNSAAVGSEDKPQVSTVEPTKQSSPVKANNSQVSEDQPLPTETTASIVSESNSAPSDGVALETEMDTTAPIVPQESEPLAPVSDEQASDAAEVMDVDKPTEVAATELPSQNGTEEPHIVSPSKSPAANEKVYVPSSSAIDSRKFIPNSNFPPELMDPASWFSVVSYNILADCHLCKGDYSFTQPQFLAQDYRHSLLLKELDYLDGDIVCLQEVNPSYFTNTLLPALKSRGYDGQIFKRTKDLYDEGEATLVKLSKFDVVSHQSVSLKDLVYKEIEASTLSEDVSNAVKKYLDRADVILLTELKCKKTGKTLTVCNIHVVYDRLAPDVQSIQVASAIKRLVAQAGSDQNPHIICGDFNSDITSPAYQLARDGYLSDDHIRKLQNLQALDTAEGTSRSLIHHLWNAFQHTSSNLKNAYEITLGKEPPITAMSPTSRKLQALDHVFYSSASIDNVGVLETIDVEVVEGCGGIPSKNIPSDHLSVKAVFRLK